jgi:hypothetical protein
MCIYVCIWVCTYRIHTYITFSKPTASGRVSAPQTPAFSFTVSLRVCMCIHVCVCVCVCIYVYTYSIHMYITFSMPAASGRVSAPQTPTLLFTVSLYVCMCVCVHEAYMYVCAYIYICIHTYIMFSMPTASGRVSALQTLTWSFTVSIHTYITYTHA